MLIIELIDRSLMSPHFFFWSSDFLYVGLTTVLRRNSQVFHFLTSVRTPDEFLECDISMNFDIHQKSFRDRVRESPLIITYGDHLRISKIEKVISVPFHFLTSAGSYHNQC